MEDSSIVLMKIVVFKLQLRKLWLLNSNQNVFLEIKVCLKIIIYTFNNFVFKYKNLLKKMSVTLPTIIDSQTGSKN